MSKKKKKGSLKLHILHVPPTLGVPLAFNPQLKAPASFLPAVLEAGGQGGVLGFPLLPDVIVHSVARVQSNPITNDLKDAK